MTFLNQQFSRYLVEIFRQFQHTTLQVITVSFRHLLQINPRSLRVYLKALLLFPVLAKLAGHVGFLSQIVQKLPTFQVHHSFLNDSPDTSWIFCSFVNRAGISFDVIDVLLGYCSDLHSVL